MTDQVRKATVASAGRDVATVRWPAEAHWREYLAARDQPRLLLVDPGVPAPPIDTDLEDWAPESASAAELDARRMALLRRAASKGAAPQAAPPTLDEYGVLRVGEDTVILPPIEARILRVLLEHVAAVVPRDVLVRAVWPQRAPASNALDVQFARLRKRVGPLGFSIQTIRRRGYLLKLPIVT